MTWKAALSAMSKTLTRFRQLGRFRSLSFPEDSLSISETIDWDWNSAVAWQSLYHPHICSNNLITLKPPLQAQEPVPKSVTISNAWAWARPYAKIPKRLMMVKISRPALYHHRQASKQSVLKNKQPAYCIFHKHNTANQSVSVPTSTTQSSCKWIFPEPTRNLLATSSE